MKFLPDGNSYAGSPNPTPGNAVPAKLLDTHAVAVLAAARADGFVARR